MSSRAVPSIAFAVIVSIAMVQIEPTPAAAADTTTSSVSQLVIPETLPYENLYDGEGFSLKLGCDPTNGTDDPADDLVCGPDDVLEYAGHGMPYLYSDAKPGHHDHAWWVPGDREAYRCAYAFMYDKHPNPFGGEVVHPNAHFIARVTVVVPREQAYGLINDAAMSEGVRYYDGTPYQGGTAEIPDEDCQPTSLDPDFDYDAYVPKGPEEIRVGLFRKDGEIGDIRDFAETEGHYEFVKLDDFGGPNGPGDATSRVTLVHIEPDIQKVSHVIYYDTLTDGLAAAEVDGEIVATSCLSECEETQDPGQPPAGGFPFLDIADSTFVDDIVWLADSGITQGCNPPANDHFCPNDNVTRGQMAAFLTRALDLPDGPDVFTDDENSTFEGDNNALARAGITLGCNPPANDHFCPNDNVTRGQMAAFLHRASPLFP